MCLLWVTMWPELAWGATTSILVVSLALMERVRRDERERAKLLSLCGRQWEERKNKHSLFFSQVLRRLIGAMSLRRV